MTQTYRFYVRRCSLSSLIYEPGSMFSLRRQIPRIRQRPNVYPLLPDTLSCKKWNQRKSNCSRLLFGSRSKGESDNKSKVTATESPIKPKDTFYDHWTKQLRSPPNMITLSRIASAPLLSYLIVTNQHEAALFGCLVAGLSDVLDGYLAKHHNMSTVLGTYLDPLADKILINVLSVSLWCNGTLPTPLVALWLMRDVGLSAGAYLYVASNTESGLSVTDPLTTPLKINPTLSSKVNTAFQFATLSVGILQPMYPVLSDVLVGLCWLTGATTIASGISYLGYSAFTESGNRHSTPSDRSDSKHSEKK